MQSKVVNHEVFIMHEDSEQWEFAFEEVRVKTRHVDLLKGKQTVEIEMWPETGCVLFEIERSGLNRTLISRLLDYGLSLIDTNDNAECLMEYIIESEKNAEIKFHHDHLGFQMIGNDEVVLLHHPVNLTDMPKSESVYINPNVTEPKGEIETWETMVREEILGTNLEMGVAIGAAGPVAHILRTEGMLSEVPLLAITGPSSSGKTLTLRVAASLYGKPEISGGYIISSNATELALSSRLTNAKGLVLLIDESTASAGSAWDMQKLLYNLSTGEDRYRCSPSGDLRLPKTFSGMVAVTGERSLFQYVDSDLKGLRSRLLELRAVWSNDQNHAVRVEQAVRKNYGTAGPLLINWLLHHKKCVAEEYEKMHEQLKLEMREEMKKHPAETGVLDRLLKTVAVLLISAAVLYEVFQFELNVVKMRDLLLNACKEALSEQSDAEKAYDAVMLYVSSHSTNFPQQIKGKYHQNLSVTNLWGVRVTSGMHELLWISSEKLEEILKRKNIFDLREILRKWYADGAILKHVDRFKKKHKVGAAEVPCYCLVLGKYQPPAPPSKKKKRKFRIERRQQVKPISKQIVDLLADEVTENGETAEE